MGLCQGKGAPLLVDDPLCSNGVSFGQRDVFVDRPTFYSYGPIRQIVDSADQLNNSSAMVYAVLNVGS
jgi:hypothetical protein